VDTASDGASAYAKYVDATALLSGGGSGYDVVVVALNLDAATNTQGVPVDTPHNATTWDGFTLTRMIRQFHRDRGDNDTDVANAPLIVTLSYVHEVLDASAEAMAAGANVHMTKPIALQTSTFAPGVTPGRRHRVADVSYLIRADGHSLSTRLFEEGTDQANYNVLVQRLLAEVLVVLPETLRIEASLLDLPAPTYYQGARYAAAIWEQLTALFPANSTTRYTDTNTSSLANELASTTQVTLYAGQRIVLTGSPADINDQLRRVFVFAMPNTNASDQAQLTITATQLLRYDTGAMGGTESGGACAPHSLWGDSLPALAQQFYYYAYASPVLYPKQRAQVLAAPFNPAAFKEDYYRFTTDDTSEAAEGGAAEGPLTRDEGASAARLCYAMNTSAPTVTSHRDVPLFMTAVNQPPTVVLPSYLTTTNLSIALNTRITYDPLTESEIGDVTGHWPCLRLRDNDVYRASRLVNSYGVTTQVYFSATLTAALGRFTINRLKMWDAVILVSGTGVRDRRVSLVGPLDALEELVCMGIVYECRSDGGDVCAVGAVDAVEVVLNDLGNYGLGGPLEDTAVFYIDIASS
jgi:CheY-like chemotaxis protein